MAAVESHKSSEAEMKSYFVLCETCLLLESTIKHEIAPEALNSICAENISENLKDQFAFLSGGQGKDGAAIITFPEYPNFGDISKEVVQKIVTYLTTIPSLHQPEIKFIFILDRRQDTWGSIKTSLAHIAASCPENLQLVLVLRPSGFFQRAISDISFRFSHDDFILKLPVVMLSSVTELLKYIDDTHLTQEYGGTLEYCHNEWILFRTAIESFAVMVKEIAQMLQSFGTDLAEAELPDDLHFVEDLLLARTEKYNQLKEDVRRVIKEGELLLTNLMEPLSNEPHTQDGVEKNDDRATVKRLLAQLHEMETAFDGFWEKHLLKLEQCLQLWRFEQAFQEVKMIVDCLAAEEGDIPETGDNVAHTEQALRELSNLDERSQELVENAQHLVLQGDHLISNHHYAMDLIWEKCNELHHSCEDLCDEMRKKFITLNRSLELHTRLQQALDWCDQGTYLLASQSMDKCQSQEGAKRVLQEIERFLENSTYYLQRDTEALYIEFQSILTSRLKAQIEVVHGKLENVHGMFEKRQTCLEKLAAKQARPVQPVAPRPDTSPLQYKSPLFSSKQGADTNPSPKFPFDISLYGKKHVKKNQNTRKIEVMHEACQRPWFSSSVEGEDNLDVLKGHVINELIETERVYVEELHTILQGYRVEMDNPSMLHLLPSVLQNKKEILFGNMSEIHDFHSRMFLHDLQNCIETPEKVGLCFLARKANFQMYVKYCQNKPRSEALWRQCSDSFFFQECQRKLDHKLALDSYLLKPIQRLTKYQLLLKELLKFCNGDGIQDLQEALEAMLNLLKCVNDSMHQIAITGYNGNLEDFGRVLMQGSFNVWINHKKGPTKMKDLARFKPMHRHLFLHERALLFCKKREEHGEGYDKAPSYSFKHYLKMSAVGITENVKGDIKKFEVWYSGREEVYLIQAPTVDVKLAWLNEIRKVLTNQEKLSREDSTLHHQVSDQILLSPGKQKRASLSSEENDSDLPSPVVLENIVFSPNLSPRKDWAGTSRFTEASEGNDDLSSNNDTEEEDVNQLSPGKYKAQSDCKKGDSEELLIKSGDPVQLVNEDGEGQWFVKNLNRGQQAWISVHNLQIIVGDCKSQGPGSSETLQFEQSQDIT